MTSEPEADPEAKTSETPTSEKERKNPLPWYEVMQDGQGWHWQLWGANGSPIARNAVAYLGQKECIQALRALGRHVGKAVKIMRSNMDE